MGVGVLLTALVLDAGADVGRAAAPRTGTARVTTTALARSHDELLPVPGNDSLPMIR